MKFGNIFAELKRRNVIRAAILYVGAVWALGQGISQLGPSVGAPEWATRWFLVAAAIGFPFWIAFAWFYEFTPEGLKRESEIDPAESITQHAGRKLDFAIIGVLAVAVVLLLTDRFVLRHGVKGPVDSRIRMTAFEHVTALYWRQRPYFYAALVACASYGESLAANDLLNSVQRFLKSWRWRNRS